MKFKELETGVAYKLGDEKTWNHAIGFVLDTEQKYTKWGSKYNGTLVAMLINRVGHNGVDEKPPANLEEARRYRNPQNTPPTGWRVEYVALGQIKMTWDTWVPLGIMRRESVAAAVADRNAKIADHTARKERIAERAAAQGVKFEWKHPYGAPIDRPDVILTPDQFEGVLTLLEQLESLGLTEKPER